jgi:hypothetical protein
MKPSVNERKKLPQSQDWSKAKICDEASVGVLRLPVELGALTTTNDPIKTNRTDCDRWMSYFFS